MTPFEDLAGFERRLGRTHLLLVIGTTAVLAVLISGRGALSFAAGGLVSFINARWLKHIADVVLAPASGGSGAVGPRRGGYRVGLQYAGRYALIGLAVFVTIRFSMLDVVLLLAGVVSYVFAVLLECIFEVGRSLVRTHPDGT